MNVDEWVIKEVIATLQQANTTLIGSTGLDTSQEFEKKCIKNKSAINRRIERAISLLNSVND